MKIHPVRKNPHAAQENPRAAQTVGQAGEWRNAVVAEVGRKRHDELSSKPGTDLALAYVDHRTEQMMVGRMERDQMPKGASTILSARARRAACWDFRRR